MCSARYAPTTTGTQGEGGAYGHILRLLLFDILDVITSNIGVLDLTHYFTHPNPNLLPYPTLPYPTRPYPPLPYPTLPYPTLPYPTLPYPPLPYPTLPYPTLP